MEDFCSKEASTTPPPNLHLQYLWQMNLNSSVMTKAKLDRIVTLGLNPESGVPGSCWRVAKIWKQGALEAVTAEVEFCFPCVICGGFSKSLFSASYIFLAHKMVIVICLLYKWGQRIQWREQSVQQGSSSLLAVGVLVYSCSLSNLSHSPTYRGLAIAVH